MIMPKPREVDQLEERIFDLEDDLQGVEHERDGYVEELGRLDTENEMLKSSMQNREEEIADLLYEVDYLNSRLEAAHRDWEGVVECVRERAEKAERERDVQHAWAEDWHSQLEQANTRAASWWEVAKEQTRSRNLWLRVADEQMDMSDGSQAELAELKAALRTLGR